MMKKIAYITSGVNGIHRFTYNELSLLKDNGIDFNLCLTQLKKGPCMPKNEWVFFTANRFKAIKCFIVLLITNKEILKMFFEARKKNVLSYFFISLSLYSDIKKNDISSIHCQMGDEKLYIGYFLKKIMDIPLSVTVHAHELYSRKVYDNNDEIRELYSSCDQVLTISEFNSEIINKDFGVKKEKLKVMRLFPDIDVLNYVKGKTKILIVAHWWRKKGYDVLIKALKNLKRDDYVLWVVGNSYHTEDSIDVEKLVKENKMESQVAILGPQGSPILDILFQSCDIFCLPSYTEYYSDNNPSSREGIPVALMEAMAWGKPVIATDHAGNTELVEKFIVKEKDIETLTKTFEYLFDNKDKWNEYGKRNQQVIRDKYSKTNIDILVNTFNSL